MSQTDLIIVESQLPSTNVEPLDPITQAIVTWVHNKKLHSGSVRTEQTYEKTIKGFRAHLRAHGRDLDSPRKTIAPYLQAWAASGAGKSGATLNQRLSIVSSFYTYARKRDLLTSWEEESDGNGAIIRRRVPLDNPADYVERAKVIPYGKATALQPETVSEKLAALSSETSPLGLRDYALLAVAFTTGRRLAELAGLEWQDVEITGPKRAPRVALTWRRAKGNKELADQLEPAVGDALLRYLRAVYNEKLEIAPEAPIWVSLDFARTRLGRQPMAALSPRAIEYRYKRLLGKGKAHISRHSFALGMKKAGAPLDVIQERLAHESLETTAEYLPKLERSENPYAPSVAALFGLGSRKKGHHATRG